MSVDSPASFDFDGDGLRILIVAARFNGRFVDAMIERAVERLIRSGVDSSDIEVVRVPGSNEIPQAIAMVTEAVGDETPDAVIGLGVVIAGDTTHHEVIGNSTALMLHTLAIDLSLPIINGIVVCETIDQAEVRCLGDLDRGSAFASAALEMAGLAITLGGVSEDE